MKPIIVLFLCSTLMSVAYSQNEELKSVNSADLIQDILKTWEKHNAFNLLILNSIEEEHLNDYSASRGRNVGEQLVHINEVRLNWLTEVAPDEAKSLQLIPNEKLSIQILKENLTASGNTIKKVLSTSLKEGKLKNYSGTPVSFACYLISHESHHRGQILLSLKQNGHEVSPRVSFGIWNWQD